MSTVIIAATRAEADALARADDIPGAVYISCRQHLPRQLDGVTVTAYAATPSALAPGPQRSHTERWLKHLDWRQAKGAAGWWNRDAAAT